MKTRNKNKLTKDTCGMELSSYNINSYRGYLLEKLYVIKDPTDSKDFGVAADAIVHDLFKTVKRMKRRRF